MRPVFPEEKLRERFVRRVTPGHVAWLAFSGETEAAELLASKEESAADTWYAYWLRIGQSFAQRQNGHYAEAIATARKLEEACPQVRNIHPDGSRWTTTARECCALQPSLMPAS